MDKRDQRIGELEARLKALKSEATRHKARERMVNARKERTKDTRRKILLGAWLLRQLERGELSRESIQSALESYLERDEDRALFDLGPRAAAPPGAAATAPGRATASDVGGAAAPSGGRGR